MSHDEVRALRIIEHDGRIIARVEQVNRAHIGAGDVEIRAQYSSVNYKDALAATGAGKIIRRFPLIGGIDVAGTVIASADSRWQAGAPVVVTGFDFGVSHDGGYAEYVRVPAAWVVALPPGLTPSEAMAIGTAGFTAALSIVELERQGLAPSHGPVLVTGATGGVGSLAVQMLSRLGYAVTALTGKSDQHEHLRQLGAAHVLSRHDLVMGTRPLEKPMWAGAVDCVGGATLAWLTRTMMYNAAIAASGLTGGTELQTTVLPFILRGTRLIGIDSVMCPTPTREMVWHRLATDLKPPMISANTHEIGLEQLGAAFDTLLKGEARGRFLVRLTER